MTAPAPLPITVPPIVDAPLPRWLADIVAGILLRQVDRDNAKDIPADELADS